MNTMSNQPYFPTRAAARAIWLANISKKAAIHAAQLNFTSQQVADLQADIAYLLWILLHWYPAMQQSSLEYSVYRDLIATGSGNEICPLPSAPVFADMPEIRLPGILPRIFNMVQLAKLGSGYTEAIGQDMGIIGKADSTSHVLPDFAVAIELGDGLERVKFTFTKYDHDGIYIETRRNNGTWEFLAIAMSKPYYDDRPVQAAGVPEIREYRIRWWDNGNANGDFTPVQKITVSP